MKNCKIILFLFLLSSCAEAQQGKTEKATASEIYLTKPGEPGKPFTLHITVRDINTRQPVPGIEVFAYHTNNKGDYEEGANGIARIHGTALSDKNGNIILHTIYPRGYNDSPTGEHIHFEIKTKGYKPEHPGLLFADFNKKRYDYKNPVIHKVYLETLEETNGIKTGKAIMYVQKIK